jgi:hypothetical protein
MSGIFGTGLNALYRQKYTVMGIRKRLRLRGRSRLKDTF